ncbi:MAG TPA: YdcF family protein [Cyclobacteriaceae bacterium]|jgi:uncharacterized SAM-binding protein YcdF (DUF218 family)|nr:YdcF family protein [Cyclobacteriaceae bacterium]
MFFFLSKVLLFLVMPFTVVCGLLLAAAFARKIEVKKKFLVAGLAVIFVFSNEFIANEAMKLWELPVTPIKDLKKNYELGIVLTGMTIHDVGPNDRVYFNASADRATHTVQLYKMGKIKKVLVSGGSGRLDAPEAKEAFEVASALMMMGVLKDDLMLESESRNTHESAEAVKKMLANDIDPSECLLITSGYHMRRSRACFKKVGLNFDTFTVDFRSHYRKYNFDVLFVPKAEVFGVWSILVKEWVGMIVYKFAGYI